MKGVESQEINDDGRCCVRLGGHCTGFLACGHGGYLGFANFGNAQDAVNALTAAGYNVQINGATVFPLSSCKVIQVEGLNNSNIDSDGKRIDSTKFDTVYVDVSCRGG